MAGKVLLLLVTSAICLVLLEAAVRWLFPYFDPQANVWMHMTTNGVLGVAMKSARMVHSRGEFDTQIRFNEDGFRDSKVLREAKPDDWFALGDSFTMGWGVDEDKRFANLFEEGLKHSGQPHARVFNIAIPDNITGYARLLKYAESRGPKVNHLLVGICMENDLRNYSDGRSQWELSSKNKAGRNWLSSRLASYHAAAYFLQSSPFVSRQLEQFGIIRPVDAFNQKAVWDEAALKSSRDELLKVVSGRDATVLIIPSRRLWHGDNTVTERRVHESFVQLLREANLRVVDMAPAMEKAGSPLTYYFVADPHWNARGHALAAERLLAAQISPSAGLNPR